LSLFCALCPILPVCLWIVFFNVYHFIVLPQGTTQRKSRDIQAESATRHSTKKIQRHTGRISHKHSTKKIQRHTGRIGHKAQHKENPETYRQTWAQGTAQRKSCMPLDCLCSVPCAQSCLYFSGLSLFCAMCPIMPVCLWIVFVLCLVPKSACMSLDFLCAVEQRQSGDRQELGTMHRTKTIQRHRGRIGYKVQNKDNPETYRQTWAQGTAQRQSRDIQT
jgi:hypothetical protein